jgi:hypothetical protein
VLAAWLVHTGRIADAQPLIDAATAAAQAKADVVVQATLRAWAG